MALLPSFLISLLVYLLLFQSISLLLALPAGSQSSDSSHNRIRTRPMLRLARPSQIIRLKPEVNDFIVDDDDFFELNKRQTFDDYGHLRFGKRDDFDDYGHMRFGRSGAE